MSSITIRDVRKSYGKAARAAVEKLSLEIYLNVTVVFFLVLVFWYLFGFVRRRRRRTKLDQLRNWLQAICPWHRSKRT